MKEIIKLSIIFIIFIGIFVFLNYLLAPKYAESLVEGSMTSAYYDEVKDHEVIFLGDCEVYANFSPMVMYEETGIKAYVRGNSQQLIWQSYYLLEETLKYEVPKVVVLNVNAMRYGKDSEEVSEPYNRLMIDKMKWSLEKINLIKESVTEEETFISYVFPLLRYHSRYSSLTREDFEYLFKDKKNTYNGFLINKNIKAVDNLPTKRVLPDYSFPSECYEFLNKILELCKENDIELVLIKAPSLYPYWYDEYDNAISNYAEENDIDYYNLLNNVEEIGLDYAVDTYDGGLHLNLTGATKLSKYFAHILADNYDLNTYINDPIYDDKLEEYKEVIA